MKRSTAVINGKRLALYRWGSPKKPPLVLIHGWMDSAATFDAVSDRLSQTHHVVALDLHGFGRSSHSPLRTGYHFHAHLADVHFLVTKVLKAQAVALVGHSMGGNIALYFAGMFPELVSRLVSVEGWGLPSGDPEKAVEKFRKWILAVEGQPRSRVYKTLDEYLERLAKSAPRTEPRFLRRQAAHLVKKAKGGYALRADVAHFLPEPDVYSAADFERFASRIHCPTLLVYGSETSYSWGHDLLKIAQKTIPGDRATEVIIGAGHMMHFEQPVRLAEIIGGWLSVPAK